MKTLKTQSIGLFMIVGTLVVIGLIAYQSMLHQHSLRTANIRAQGLSLVQLISEVPSQQVTKSGLRNTLNVLQQSLGKEDFAYAVVVNKNGTPMAQATAAGVLIPHAVVSTEPSSWTGERSMRLENERDVSEFYAPLLLNSELKGSVRIGFYQPTLLLGMENLSYIATLALPVFLLAPLFYFLMRRQLKPLQSSQREIAQQLREGMGQKIDLKVDGELGDFMANFNEYFRHASSRIQGLESDNHTMLASSKVLHYKFGRIESVLEALPSAVLVFDDSGSLTYANNRVASLIGVEKDVVLNQPVASWSPNDEVFRYLARCSDPSNKVLPELRTEIGEQSIKTVRLTAFPLMSEDGQGKSRGNLVLIQDASKDVAAESSREEFVAHISHELKTPLNTLMMYAESLLGEDGKDDHFRAEGLNVIYDESERMAGLISNLLSITKIEMGSLNVDRQRVKFNEFIEDTFQAIEKGAEDNGLNFHLQLPDDTVAVAIDKALMSIAVNNLLTNAVKYNKPGGTISLEVEELDESVRLTVRDTGIGISEADLEHVFDKFYRSDSDEVRERTGHGLGLSLAYDIVQLHNGRLSASSEKGVGTQFTIDLLKESELLRKVS